MRSCASKVCRHNTRHHKKWLRNKCAIHGVNHANCTCSPPFRFHYFPTDPYIREEWVKRVDRQEPQKSGVTPRRWEPRKESVLCSDHFVNGAPSEKYPVPWFKMGKDFGTPTLAKSKYKRSTFLTILRDGSCKRGKRNPDGTLTLLPEPVPDIDSVISEHNYSYNCKCCQTCPGCYEKEMNVQQLSGQIKYVKTILAEKDIKISQLTQHAMAMVSIVAEKDTLSQQIKDLKKIVAEKDRQIELLQRRNDREKDATVTEKLEAVHPTTSDVLPGQKVGVEAMKFHTELMKSDGEVGLPSKAELDLLFEYLEPKLDKMQWTRSENDECTAHHLPSVDDPVDCI